MPSLPIASLPVGDGTVAVNQFLPDFNNPLCDVFLFSNWGRINQKYLRANDDNQFVVISTASYRDFEFTYWARRINIFVRVVGGIGFQIGINEEVNVLSVLIHNNITTGVYDSNFSNWWEPFSPQSVDLTTVPGYNQANAAGRNYTIGFSGFDFYMKMNGVEFFRKKHWLHVTAGKVQIHAQGDSAYGLAEFSLTALSPPSMFSNPDANYFDPRDFGLKGVKTTGSMSAGSNLLTVADASNFAVGDKIIVEIGGEAGGGHRGTKGVGGQWPALTYATPAARDADHTREDGRWCWDTTTGLTKWYDISTGTWRRSTWAPGDWYWSKALPKALLATVTAKAGSVLTLDTAASNATTSANVHIDTTDALRYILSSDYGSNQNLIVPTNVVYNIPNGQFAVSKGLTVGNDRRTWDLRGQGKDFTTFYSPDGASTLNFSLGGVGKVHDFEIVGNAGDEFYGPVTWGDQWFAEIARDAPGMGFVPGLIVFEAYNIRTRDVWRGAASCEYTTGGYVHDCECILSNGWRMYISWMYGCSDSLNCKFERLTVTAPSILGGFECFRSDGAQFIDCHGINTLWSSNSSGNFLFENCSVNMQANCELTYVTDYGETYTWAKAWMNPIMQANSNIQPPNAAMAMGGEFRNCTIIVEGYANAAQDSFQSGITINQFNPNIKVTGVPAWVDRPTSAPHTGGYFQFPNAVGSASGADGALAVRADGGADSIIVDGIRIVGLGNPVSYGRGNAQILGPNTAIRNCVFEDHSAFGYPGPYPGLVGDATKTNNKTTGQWMGVGATGSLVQTLAGIGLSTAGAVRDVGTLAKPLANVTASGAGVARANGTLTKALNAATVSAAGVTRVAGSLPRTLGTATVSAAGTASQPGIALGTLIKTLNGATLSAAAATRVTATLAQPLAAATLSAGAGARATGTLARTLGTATLAGTGIVTTAGSHTGVLAQTLAATAAAAGGVVRTSGTLAQPLAAASLSSAGAVRATGTLARALGTATLSAGTSQVVTGNLVRTLGTATISATGTAPIPTVVTGDLTRTFAEAKLDANGSARFPISILDRTLSAVRLKASGTVRGFSILNMKPLTVEVPMDYAGSPLPRTVPEHTSSTTPNVGVVPFS